MYTPKHKRPKREEKESTKQGSKVSGALRGPHMVECTKD